MIGRWLRWLIVAGVAVFGFGLVWWVAEGWFRLDRSTAVTIATAAGSLMATPFVRWAGDVSQPSVTAPPTTSERPGPGVVAAPSQQTGPRAGLAVLVGVVAVVACLGLGQLYGPLVPDRGRSPNGPGVGAGARAGAQTQTLEVNKMAWFAGYLFTFGRATYDREAEPALTVAAVAENLGLRNVAIDLEPTFSIGDRHSTGRLRERPTIPGRQKSDVVFEFDFDLLEADLADGVLTFGDARVARTVIPLGGGDGLIAHEPRQVLGPTTVVHRDLRLDITLCEVRADIAPEHRQAPDGHLVLACWVDATYNGGSSFHYFDEDNYRLKLPDGNAIAPTEYPIATLYNGVTAPATYVAFVIKEPALGAYTLQIVDRHTGESESQAPIKDIPLSL